MIATKEEINKAKHFIISLAGEAITDDFEYKVDVSKVTDDGYLNNTYISNEGEELTKLTISFTLGSGLAYLMSSLDNFLRKITSSNTEFWPYPTVASHISLNDCTIVLSNFSDEKLLKSMHIDHAPEEYYDLIISLYLNKKE